jgi:precorrin-8X/cobalt-precorrin-8 methylmutase
MAQMGVVVLAHGSRGERGISEVPEALDRITRGLRPLLSQDVEIMGAALQFNRPNLEEAAEMLISRGANLVVVAPYFLFFGRHLTEDIPRIIQGLKKAHPDKRFIVTDNLGLDDYFIDLIARRIAYACPDLGPDTRPASCSPASIEEQSMEIVERFLPHELAGDERIITRRMVHASGDPFLATLVKFSPSAASSGREAIAAGRPIFTDVRMVAAGINSHLVETLGCSLFCALDEPHRQGEDKGLTRAASAMYGLEPRLNSAIVAIGNAPTALFAIIDMIDQDRVAPALVVGMPVGFVQALESKAELMKRRIPFITVEGTRGGSALAAAAVNALLKLSE